MRVPTLLAPVGTGAAANWFRAIALRKLASAVQSFLVLHPVPDNCTCCGLLESLSVITRFAVNEPTAVGKKFTEMSHELTDAIFVTLLTWQAEVRENGAFVCTMDWSEMFSASLSVFVA